MTATAKRAAKPKAAKKKSAAKAKKKATKKKAKARKKSASKKAATKETSPGEVITATANGGSKHIKVQFYIDTAGEHRWRLVRRGRIIGASTEGYTRAVGARSNFRSLREAMGLVKL